MSSSTTGEGERKLPSLPYVLIDSFTTTPSKGNPAAVVLFPNGASDPRSSSASYMLSVAREFNLSETAFLSPLVDSTPLKPHYSLRWFTPSVEFPLCGHATLASTRYLLGSEEEGLYGHHEGAEEVRFETLSGTLKARHLESGEIELDFPADDRVSEAVEEEDRRVMMNALKVLEGGMRQKGFEVVMERDVVSLAKGKLGWIVEFTPEVELEKLPLNLPDAFKRIDGYFMFTQTANETEKCDIKSRVLDPVEDIQEDPVTGSAHCMLVPYYLGQLTAFERLKTCRPSFDSTIPVLKARQVSARGGDLTVEWNKEMGRCKLRGYAVTVMSGRLLL